jgi:hypothetical protein
LGETHFGVIDIFPIQKNGACVPGPKDQICQTIEALEKRGLPAPGRTENGKYLIRLNMEIDILKGLQGVVVEIEIFNHDLLLWQYAASFRPDGGYID